MRLLAFLIAMGLASLNTACSVESVGSDTVDANKINQDYSVTYSEGTNSVYTYAQFRNKDSFGDTVELLYPSYVLVNGSPMSHTNFLGSYYSRELRGYTQKVSFEYYDRNGIKYHNGGEVLPISLQSYSSTLSLKTKYSVKVTAINLRPKESIVLEICQEQIDNETGGQKTECVTSDSLTTTVGFSINQLKTLKSGHATMNVRREINLPLNEGTDNTGNRGNINLKYISQDISINVTDN